MDFSRLCECTDQFKIFELTRISVGYMYYDVELLTQ